MGLRFVQSMTDIELAAWQSFVLFIPNSLRKSLRAGGSYVLQVQIFRCADEYRGIFSST